ncbi:MAG: class I SAM-dependent methyltransferase, partial [Verrucomicrobiota bacterium]
MDIADINRKAWNQQSTEGCRWSTPFDDQVFTRAKAGDWDVKLTPNKPVPQRWFPELAGANLLALACGGGQQVPIFSALGAHVTSFDNSDVQLEKDRDTCSKHGLSATTVQGDMADLSAFDNDPFDLIFNPVSNVFCAELKPIWQECYRVLRPGGRMMCGFLNPAFYLFDHYEAEETGKLDVRHKLPYSDLDSM